MFDVIAHRGASDSAPENTLAAISKAVEIGVDFIEIDVHLSKDGIPVVIHDAMLKRTTNAQVDQRIADMTLKEIKSLDAGNWFDSSFLGESIPTLQEVLELKRDSSNLMIEIKKGPSQIKTIVKSVCELVCQSISHSKGEIVLGSFSLGIIDEIRNQYPHLSLIGIIEDFNMIPFMRSKKLPKLAFWYKLLNPTLIQQLHEEEAKIWAFTVDDLKTAQFLLSIHTDGLITNKSQTMLDLKRDHVKI
jgi:glycerophosphoryl diester phosphodiesterase